MPNVPAQFPNIDLPGAEYFALAPNASVALGGRRRVQFLSTNTSIPASSTGTSVGGSIVLESPFTNTSGIYLHYFFLNSNPSAPGLTIANSLAGLSLAPGSTQFFGTNYPLGIPVIASQVVNISTVILQDRDKLIAAKDIFGTVGQQLFLCAALNVSNTTAGAINMLVSAQIIYTRLDGLTE